MIGHRAPDHGGMGLVALLNSWRAAAQSTSVLTEESAEWLEAIATARARRAAYDERLDAIVRAQRMKRLNRPRPWAR